MGITLPIVDVAGVRLACGWVNWEDKDFALDKELFFGQHRLLPNDPVLKI